MKMYEQTIRDWIMILITIVIGWFKEKNIFLINRDTNNKIYLIQEIVYKNIGFGSLRYRIFFLEVFMKIQSLIYKINILLKI